MKGKNKSKEPLKKSYREILQGQRKPARLTDANDELTIHVIIYPNKSIQDAGLSDRVIFIGFDSIARKVGVCQRLEMSFG